MVAWIENRPPRNQGIELKCTNKGRKSCPSCKIRCVFIRIYSNLFFYTFLVSNRYRIEYFIFIVFIDTVYPTILHAPFYVLSDVTPLHAWLVKIIWSPKVLVLHIQRTKWPLGKLKDHITFPMNDLDMKPYSTKEAVRNIGSNGIYELVGVG